MLPLAQLSRKGSRVRLWGQVRPGSGAQRYVIQRRSGSTWTAVAKPQLTNKNGFFSLTVRASKQGAAPALVPERSRREPAAYRPLGRDPREQRFGHDPRRALRCRRR